MMKARRISTITIFTLVTVLSTTAVGFGAPKDLYSSEIKKAVSQAISAWKYDNPDRLKRAMEKLTRNESYLLAIGLSNKEKSYLLAVPKSINQDINSVAAYLFLLRTERRQGIDFRRLKTLFEGKIFTYQKEIN